jgi:hypothetical protein
MASENDGVRMAIDPNHTTSKEEHFCKLEILKTCLWKSIDFQWRLASGDAISALSTRCRSGLSNGLDGFGGREEERIIVAGTEKTRWLFIAPASVRGFWTFVSAAPQRSEPPVQKEYGRLVEFGEKTICDGSQRNEHHQSPLTVADLVLRDASRDSIPRLPIQNHETSLE